MNVETDGPDRDPNETNAAASLKHERSSCRWETLVARMQHLFARGVAWMATRMWQLTVDWRAVRPVILRASAHLAGIARRLPTATARDLY